MASTSITVSDKETPFWYIYFVKSSETGLIKVGRTRRLASRLAALEHQMGTHPLTLLCCIPTFNEALENHFLKLLKPYCVDGNEWFRLPERHLFSIITEVLRGFRHWSDYPLSNIRDHVAL